MVNKINGTFGSDNLEGTSEKDIIIAGKGHDTIIGTQGSDILDGGEGIDSLLLYWYNPDVGVDVNLTTGENTLGYTIKNIENIFGSWYDDNITGNIDDNIFYGDGGNDRIFGLGGIDTIYGEEGNDIIHGGKQDDVLHGDFIEIDFSDREGRNICNNGNDKLYGDDGNDIIYGDTHRVSKHTKILDGKDILHGGNGNDWLYGGGGNDKIFGDAGNDKLYGENGNDVIYFGNGKDDVWGGKGQDIFKVEKLSNGDSKLKDIIHDFNLKEDKLDLSDLGIVASNIVIKKSKSDIYNVSSGNKFSVEIDSTGSGKFTLSHIIGEK